MSKTSLLLSKVATFLAGAGAGACLAIVIDGAIRGESPRLGFFPPESSSRWWEGPCSSGYTGAEVTPAREGFGPAPWSARVRPFVPASG